MLPQIRGWKALPDSVTHALLYSHRDQNKHDCQNHQNESGVPLLKLNLMFKRTALMLTLVFVLWPLTAISQDTSRTTYRSDYSGTCSSSIRFTESPPARYWCRFPNGRAIRIPMEPANVEALTRVRVCTLEALTRRDDASPCGFPGGLLLWEGKPRGDIEISHGGSSFGDPPSEPEEIFVAVQLEWDGVFPDDNNFFSLEYGNASQALRAIKVRLAGEPSAATLTPENTRIRIGESGSITLLSARKSENATWFDGGEAMLLGADRTYYLRLGRETSVPAGEYEFLTNGYLPEVSNPSAAGFLEVEAEYETGP